MSIIYEAVVTFNRLGNPRFREKARFIVTSITTEPVLTLIADPVPLTVPTRLSLTGALSDYETADDAAKDSKTAKKDRQKKRRILQGLLKSWAKNAGMEAEKAQDITLVEKCGFDVRKPIVKPTTNGVPLAPVILVKRGVVSGTVGIRAKPVLKGVGGYDAQYALGDPTVAANFQNGQTFKNGSRIKFTDLELGKLHQFRVRGIGSTGPGDWSDPVGIIVT